MRRRIMIILMVLCTFVLITDSKVVQEGAEKGIAICLQSVIPALFPFFTISSLLVSYLSGTTGSRHTLLCKLIGMPKGTEYIILIGLLGGYPTGANAIHQAWKNRTLPTSDAKRLLCFCNNAGPAFIFGICGAFFENIWYGYLIWGIQILSALFVGILLRRKSLSCPENNKPSSNLTIPGAMEKGLRSISKVCGWVILFRVLISILEHRFLHTMDSKWQILLNGMLELSNGCTQLGAIQLPGTRFIFAGFILAFGGICVTMQTSSVVGELGLGLYIPCKAVQSIFAVFLAAVLQPILFPEHETAPQYLWIAAISGIIVILASVVAVIFKKTVDFQCKSVYNPRRIYKSEGLNHAFPKENRKILQLLLLQRKTG